MGDKFLNISIDDLSDSFSEISDCIKKYYPIERNAGDFGQDIRNMNTLSGATKKIIKGSTP